MKHNEFTWKAKDGLDIFGQSWLVDEPKAVVGIIHGMGEHASRYNYLIDALTVAGVSVVAYDQRGHGKSGGKKGHTPSYDLLLSCVDDLLAKVEELVPGEPKFLFGHSMGGNVLINHLLRNNPSVNGAIVSAPWLRLAFEPPALQVKLGRLVSGILPGLVQSTKLDVNAISQDPKEVQRYTKDPLVHDKISTAFFAGVYDNGFWAVDNAASLKTPALVYHGTEDKLTSHNASKQFCEDAKGADVTFKSLHGFYHESHNEPKREDLFKMIIEWISSHSAQ
ncbi:MAG: alpha-beta hydrolase superfamily lysophospholipase [Polaribacter sp.]|jgi:alpha-beta hydrolase superfamily lysophospholipase